MAESVVFTRREALLLSATAGISIAAQCALASDSIKTAAHQAPGNCSTPRSAMANTRYGKVRGFVGGFRLNLPRHGLTNIQHSFMEQIALKTCTPGRALSRLSFRIGMTAGKVRTCSS
jgi:hypothetical protein